MPDGPPRVLSDSRFGDAWNKLTESVRGHRPLQGPGVLTSDTVHGVLRETEPQLPSYGEEPISGAPGATVRAFKIKTVFRDHFECLTWDSTWNGTIFTSVLGGTIIRVAKNRKLRGIASAIYDGVTINYTYPVSNTGFTERDASINGQWVETQIVLPRYIATDPFTAGNDVIYAVEPQGGTEVVYVGQQLTWHDLNVDGRAWARKFV